MFPLVLLRPVARTVRYSYGCSSTTSIVPSLSLEWCISRRSILHMRTAEDHQLECGGETGAYVSRAQMMQIPAAAAEAQVGIRGVASPRDSQLRDSQLRDSQLRDSQLRDSQLRDTL
uniref:Uncharacterized protein n=1 Tax=Knipowitschia caucasica TaxID=637954 RepID=A0AAV2MB77_KNICA